MWTEVGAHTVHDVESPSHAQRLYSNIYIATVEQPHFTDSMSNMDLTAFISSPAALPLPWNLLEFLN